MIHRLFSFLKVIDHYPRDVSDKTIVFSCHDADRSMQEGEKYYSPFLEGVKFLVNDMGYEPLNLSHPFAVLPSYLIKDDSITINYRVLLFRFIAASTKFMNSSQRRTELRIKIETMFYRKLLQKISPKIIFSIQPPEGLCKAARSLDVVIVELMHGTNVSSTDKLFSDHMSLSDEFLPNFILSFDDCTHNTFSEMCIGRNITALRSYDPWYHFLQYNKDKMEASSLKPIGIKFKKRVLITPQWGYDGERESLSGVIPNGIMHPELEAVLTDKGNEHIFFNIRMHPIQRIRPWYKHHRDYFEALASRLRNVEVSYSSIAPLPVLLEEVDCHITMCSSAVGEADVANIPSLLLCPTLHEGGAHFGFFRELERGGCVSFGYLDRNQISNWIQSARIRPDGDKVIYDIDKIQSELTDFYANLIEKPGTLLN